jgi:hypothetical protein
LFVIFSIVTRKLSHSIMHSSHAYLSLMIFSLYHARIPRTTHIIAIPKVSTS